MNTQNQPELTSSSDGEDSAIARQTQRSLAKEERRRALLAAAANLFASKGYSRVSLEDLGAAVGISGPAVYRHFPGKQSVLDEVLLTVSRGLLSGGSLVAARSVDPRATLTELVHFHVDFALSNVDVIRVQDRDLDNVSPQCRSEVRSLQRQYVELWVEQLGAIHSSDSVAELRLRAHATFGLINSTPHSLRGQGTSVARKTAAGILEELALAALTAGA
ncbi:TetR/AcrR family transcriptional regulator [Pseudarthrobacter sp. J1738]|uniref:SACE_7040 family transcriptional regulator n=1 Tax=unclassified Pseudarthrobacter TaxID=2647000 RepID=UPI003D29F900